MNEEMFDVVAVDLNTKKERIIASNKSKKDAEAIIAMAVMRLGLEKEYYKIKEKV